MFEMKISQPIVVLLILFAFGSLSTVAASQVPAFDGNASTAAATSSSKQLISTYTRPTHRTMVGNYIFDAYGPYPAAGAAVTAGINQFSNAPPEWGQGAEGFGKRFGSNFGMAAAGTTTRYALSEVFREDNLYYRCECRGVFPRMGHAMISTLTARRGLDGHRAFSISALVAPYAGAMTAVYGWYPDRFGAKDALRLASYNLLIYMGGNISLEFLYSGPRSLMNRTHLNNRHGAPDPGPNH
jgi:hypothetical protein